MQMKTKSITCVIVNYMNFYNHVCKKHESLMDPLILWKYPIACIETCGGANSKHNRIL